MCRDEMYETIPKVLLGFGVHSGNGFVEYQEIGIPCEGFGDENSLLLPAGKLLSEPVSQGGEGHSFQSMVDCLIVGVGGPPPPSSSSQSSGSHDFVHRCGELRGHATSLGDVPDPVTIP